jgi:chemotaxis protein MotB
MSEIPEVIPPAPPPPPKTQVIIIKKKVKGHGGHHGGAWKVAYADFVTAMMALFIVLWLMSSDNDVKDAVSKYFANPNGPGKLAGTASAGEGHSIDVQKKEMEKLREKIQQALMKVPDFKNLKDHVEITVTADGLRIELLEGEGGTFFESGKASPTPEGNELLDSLAQQLTILPNRILIEGHTDSKPYPGDDYTNWELSSDRANAARKRMTSHGMKSEQISQVRGYADRQLRHPEDPNAASNRRISVIVQYLTGPDAKADAKPDAKSEAKPDVKPDAKPEAKPDAKK